MGSIDLYDRKRTDVNNNWKDNRNFADINNNWKDNKKFHNWQDWNEEEGTVIKVVGQKRSRSHKTSDLETLTLETVNCRPYTSPVH